MEENKQMPVSQATEGVVQGSVHLPEALQQLALSPTANKRSKTHLVLDS